jgi:hypothetical protein
MVAVEILENLFPHLISQHLARGVVVTYYLP